LKIAAPTLDAARSFAESLVEQNAWHVQESEAACPKVAVFGRLDGDLDGVLTEKDLGRHLRAFEVDVVPPAVRSADDGMSRAIASGDSGAAVSLGPSVPGV
jgi:hypothetical protein